MNLLISIVTAFLTVGLAEASETMRCGSWVVSADLSVQELLAKCGEPAHKEIKESDVYARAVAGRGTVPVGKTVTERWTYDRGSRAFRMVVTIMDGKLKSIDRAE
jgi:hypothetical protein